MFGLSSFWWISWLFVCDVQVAVCFTDCAGLSHHISVEWFVAASFVDNMMCYACFCTWLNTYACVYVNMHVAKPYELSYKAVKRAHSFVFLFDIDKWITLFISSSVVLNSVQMQITVFHKAVTV